MLILGIESSAAAASAALCRDDRLLGLSYQRSGLTHSRTLLPMIRSLLENTQTDLAAVDAVAVAHGPGSFTGIRIGISTAKGLCWGAGIPAAGVSTLEAMAWLALAAPEEALVCPVMDARREQVYNAFFEIRDGRPRRRCPDRAIPAGDMAAQAAAMGRPVWVLGDGWELGLEALARAGAVCTAAPEPIRYQNAWGVAMAARGVPPQPGEALLPVYLRLSQAERERQDRLE